MSVQPVTMDHRIQPMSYGSGTLELATHFGSHMYLIIRLDSTLSQAEANAIQDGMTINAASATPFSTEPVNKESFDAVELALRQELPALVQEYGAPGTIDLNAVASRVDPLLGRTHKQG